MDANARQAFVCSVWVTLTCLLAQGVCGAREWSKRGVTTGFELPTVRTVGTCTELRYALRDVRVSKIFIAEDIRCTRSSWQRPVLVRRNVEVTGEIEKISDLTGRKRVFSIDWTDLKEVVIAERGAIAFFHHLLLLQDRDGAGGFDIDFIKSRKGATVVFVGNLVAMNKCSALPSSFVSDVDSIPRPEFLAGGQTMHALDQGSLLIEDVALWRQEVNTLWQICNTVVACGVSSPDSPLVAKYASDRVKATCSSTADEPQNEVP